MSGRLGWNGIGWFLCTNGLSEGEIDAVQPESRGATPMCRRVTCRNCDKPTYAGCGQHIDQVLRGLPVGQRCRCPRELARPRSVLSRLFGR